MALRPLRTISLFSGGGGLDLGVHAATGGRARPVVYVEREAYAAAVLVARMEEAALAPAPVWDDVSTFDARRWRGAVDCVVGGSPCQDLSVAGKRAGLDGERSGLFWEYLRICTESDAPLFFWENVGGAASALPRVFDAFAGIGFRGACVSVRASDVGAPHRRARYFVLAYRGDVGLSLLREAHHHGDGDAAGHVADGCDARVGDAGRRALQLLREPREPRELRGAERAAAGAGHAPTGGEPRAAGADVGHPSCFGRGQGRPGADTEGEACAVGAGGEVADAQRERGQLPALRQHAAEQEPHAHLSAPHVFPPGSGDLDGWRAYLAAGGPAPAEPRLRRGADGVAAGVEPSDCWVDRLRLLGNGVVPQQAAAAWRFLARHLVGGGR